ncbi:MAG: DUF1415 domain-containing protein [Bacteroidota bacterium]
MSDQFTSLPTPSDEKVILQTQCWVERFVIGHQICPFAARSFDGDRIRYKVERSPDWESCLQNLILECQLLETQTSIDTSLLIYVDVFADFEDYLDFLYMAEELLGLQGYEGTFQLASFHPDYCFADSTVDDAANYSNRSPFPMLHLLRESQVCQAVAAHGKTEQIPVRNEAYLRQAGADSWKQLLARCQDKGGE